MPSIRKAPLIVDLYSGVGGLSLGAARAGFAVRAAVELDERAATSHAVNFPNTTHLRTDVSALNGRELLQLSALKVDELSGLIGGPPCQGFSDIGHRSADDPRNELFCDFFRLVKETRPAFFLAENVPGVLCDRNSGIRERALNQIPRSYVVLKPITVKANEYGAPTSRTRVFFVGYDPTKIDKVSEEDFAGMARRPVTVKDALVGLPKLRATWQVEHQSWRKVGALTQSTYHKRIFGKIPPTVGDPTAVALLQRKRLVSGFLGTLHGSETRHRFARLRPGERDSVSKCLRLDLEGLCPTLRAGTGPERGSYQAIRPVHPTSPRVIAPREAARLQGFPDWFQFHPTKWHAFRQIGNSVSPLVSESLLRVLFNALK